MRLIVLAGSVLLSTFSAVVGAHATVLTVDASTDAEFNNASGSFAKTTNFIGSVGQVRYSSAEERYAVQFSLANLPSDAIVTQASLRLRDSEGASNVYVYGFSGNGPLTATSVTTGMQLFETQHSVPVPVAYDVSAFVEGLPANASAGFNLRQIPPSSMEGEFDTSQEDFFPELTITYTEPSATTTPEPASIALLGAGVVGFSLRQKGRRKAG